MTFSQLTRNTKQQRLIPVTKEIIRDMDNFSRSSSDASVQSKDNYKSLVQREIQKFWQESYLSSQLVNRDEMERHVKKWLEANLPKQMNAISHLEQRVKKLELLLETKNNFEKEIKDCNTNCTLEKSVDAETKSQEYGEKYIF